MQNLTEIEQKEQASQESVAQTAPGTTCMSVYPLLKNAPMAYPATSFRCAAEVRK